VLPPGRPGYGCFDPAKDVVLAPYSGDLARVAQETFETEKGRQRLESKRPILLAFAGEPTCLCTAPACPVMLAVGH
jgi:hypothetical protein